MADTKVDMVVDLAKSGHGGFVKYRGPSEVGGEGQSPCWFLEEGNRMP